MHRPATARILFTVLCLIGCAETGFSTADRALDTALAGSTFGYGTATASTEMTDDEGSSTFWDLQGSIWFDGVATDPKQSELTVTLYSARPDLQALCIDSSRFTSTDAKKERTPKQMEHWWDIEWPPSVCEDIPQRFSLGVGPYDPLLDPTLAARGMSSKGLQGAYLQVEEDGPLYIFGVVRRTELTSGRSTRDSADTGDTASTELDAAVIYAIEGLQLIPL